MPERSRPVPRVPARRFGRGGAHMGELERAVMEQLWAAEGSWRTVREVHEALAAERDIAYTTVMTVLDRLAKKKVADQRREGRAYLYRPVASRASMTAELMREALQEYADEDRRPALLAFVGEATAEDRAALREALAGLDD